MRVPVGTPRGRCPSFLCTCPVGCKFRVYSDGHRPGSPGADRAPGPRPRPVPVAEAPGPQPPPEGSPPATGFGDPSELRLVGPPGASVRH